MAKSNLIGGGAPYSEPTAAQAPRIDQDQSAYIRASTLHDVGHVFRNSSFYDGTEVFEPGAPQPEFVGADGSEKLWQHILTNVLPHARIHGVPQVGEMVPGLAFPLSPDEIERLQQIIDSENTAQARLR